MRNAASILKNILFEHEDISRQTLIRISGLDPRTVSRCMRTLAAKHLVAISRRNSGCGRPAEYYTLQMQNVRFVHFIVTKSEIYTVVSDVRRFPLFLDREEFSWNRSHPEKMTARLKQLALAALELPELKDAFVVAAGLGYMLNRIPPVNIRQRWVDALEMIFQCPCPVLSADTFLLSQYQVNSCLAGKMAGITYKDDIQCVALNDSVIDRNLQLKAEKVIADTGAKEMGFTNFICKFHPNTLKNLQDFPPEKYYNAVCMLAMNGDEPAEKLLRSYGNFLGGILVELAKTEVFDHLTLLHPRQMVSAGAMETFRAAFPELPLYMVNFSPNGFILAPAGYLIRGVREFEHGRRLNGYNRYYQPFSGKE